MHETLKKSGFSKCNIKHYNIFSLSTIYNTLCDGSKLFSKANLVGFKAFFFFRFGFVSVYM